MKNKLDEMNDSNEPKAKRGRGRPKGTVKKTEKASSSLSVSSGKRRRGRPKEEAKRGPGRPKGTVKETEKASGSLCVSSGKRRRGRPKKEVKRGPGRPKGTAKKTEKGCSSGSKAGPQVAPKRHSRSSEGGEPPRKRPSDLVPSLPPAPETDDLGRTLLHRVAMSGDVMKVAELLQRGFDPLAQDVDGDTPLHWALRLKHKDVAELLAEEGNDVPGRHGCTPLHHAAAMGYFGVVWKLLATGADTRRQNEKGGTPLHRALSHEREYVATLLMEDTANDVQNMEGQTPLHLASWRGFINIAEKLLRSGAHPHLKDEVGRYPLQSALDRGHENIALLIIRACALRGISLNWDAMRLPWDQLPRCVELLSECETEVRRMDESRLEGSRLTLRDIAQRHPTWVAPLLRKEVIRQVAGDPRSMADSFTHYGDLIASKLGDIEKRRTLLERCLKLVCLFSRPRLPALCVDVILLGLSDRDLSELAIALRPNYWGKVEPPEVEKEVFDDA